MEALMRQHHVPLYALESGDPLTEFDIIGFTMQYELSYTNLLNMLDLAGIPVRAQDRNSLTPLVIAGGPCVCNAEPFADFVDICLPGESEEVMNDLLDLFREYKEKGADKESFLQAAAQIPGVYVPADLDSQLNSKHG